MQRHPLFCCAGAWDSTVGSGGGMLFIADTARAPDRSGAPSVTFPSLS